MTKNIYTPEGFDPCTYLPDRLWKYAEEARYLLHAIESNRIFRHKPRDAWVPLKAGYLNNVMGRWHARGIRTALVETGVVECDGHYVEGKKSYGYRLGPDLRDAIFRRHPISPTLARRLNKHKMHPPLKLPIHKHLLSWLTRLEVDHDAAMRSLRTRDELIDKYVALDMIADRQFYLIVDDYGRVHTNLTSLSRRLRPFLHYGNDKLVLIDLKNSQPFFFSSLLLNYCAHDHSINSFYSYNKSPKKGKEGGGGGAASITIDKVLMPNSSALAKLDLPSDVKEYISLTETGKLYEELVGLFSVNDRDEAKLAFFKGILFCKPYPNKFYSRFRDRFPSVAKVIDALKQKDHRRLSHHLQRCESAAMIHGVCERLRAEFPEVPVWTIHDCVMTTRPHLDSVRSVVQEQFATMSLRPTISEQDFTLAA